MCTTREKIILCSKTHMTLHDVTRVLNSSYKSLRPSWNKLVSQLEKEGRIIGKYGIKAETVMKYYDIDINQLIRLEQYENGINA